jgi:hypothetical protein
MATGLADERDCDEEALPAYQPEGKRLLRAGGLIDRQLSDTGRPTCDR